MSIRLLIQTTDEKLKSIRELSLLKNKLVESDNIAKEQFNIKRTIKKLNMAGEAAKPWMKPADRRSIALDVSTWIATYSAINPTTDGVEIYQSHHRRLQPTEEKIKHAWKTYATNECKSIMGLSLFLINHLKLKDSEKENLQNRLLQLSESTDKFPSSMIVHEFFDNIRFIKHHIVTLIPNPGVQSFILKAQNGDATALDLTPEVLEWFREQDGLQQIKITIG